MPCFYEKDDGIAAIEAGHAVSHNGYAKYLNEHSFMASHFTIRKYIYVLRNKHVILCSSTNNNVAV